MTSRVESRHMRQEVVASREVETILVSAHHPFLDEIRTSMDVRYFRDFLTISRDRFSHLNLDPLNPEGPAPLDDTLILAKRDRILEKIDEKDRKRVKAGLNSAIWMYGTNPNEKKRVRKVEKRPYADHPLSVVEILLDSQINHPDTIIAAALHDAAEDTPYTLDDIGDIYGSTIQGIVRAVTKIDTKKILDKNFSDLEPSLALDFLSPFSSHPQVKRLMDTMWARHYLPPTVSELDESIRNTHPRGTPTIESLLNRFAQDPETAEQLTLLRILSSAQDRDPKVASAIPIKIADVVHNSQTFTEMSQVYGKSKVDPKARLAEMTYAPLADYLGLTDMSRAIRKNIYWYKRPQKAEKITTLLQEKNSSIENLEAFDGHTQDLMHNFSQWCTELGLQVNLSAALRNPDFLDVVERHIPLSSYEVPILEVAVDNEYASKAFSDFLRSHQTNSVIWYLSDGNKSPHLVTNITMTAPYKQRRRNFFVTISQKRNRIADVWTEKSENQKNTAKNKLRSLASRHHAAILLESLPHGAPKSITVTRSGDRYHNTDYTILVPAHATETDIRLIRNPDRYRIDYSWFDKVDTSLGREILKGKLDQELSDPHSNNKREIDVSRYTRGLNILSTLWDGWSVLNSKLDRNVSVEMHDEGYLAQIIAAAIKVNPRDFPRSIVEALGGREEKFISTRYDLSKKKYWEWMKSTPGLQALIPAMNKWLNERYYEFNVPDDAFSAKKIIYNIGYTQQQSLFLVRDKGDSQTGARYELVTDSGEAFIREQREGASVEEIRLTDAVIYQPEFRTYGFIVNPEGLDKAIKAFAQNPEDPDEHDIQMAKGYLLGHNSQNNRFIQQTPAVGAYA